MARQFGVSLVTLREALRSPGDLWLDRKREKDRVVGFSCSEINSQSIKTALGYFLTLHHLSAQHLYKVRKIIEPTMVRLASQKITAEDIRKLEKNVSLCEEKLRS